MTRSAIRRPRPPAGRVQRPVSPARYRRRRLVALLVALLLLVGLGVAARVLLYDLGLADVEEVQVTGTAAVPAEDVLRAAAVPTGEPLAAVDTDAVATRVAQLPGVATADVGRGWPHTVTIAVTERVPVARVPTPRVPTAPDSTAQGTALVDAAGVVYEGVGGADLPRLTFPAATGDPATVGAVTVLAALPEPVLAQVRTVDVRVGRAGGPAQVTLGLTDGRQLRWGAPDRNADKAAVVVPLLTREGRVYDVTSPDLPTIRS
jgi:cell division protein FtsQ